MTTVNAFTGAPLPSDGYARAVYFNQVAAIEWREACTRDKIHTATSLLEAATRRAFPVEYDAAVAASPSNGGTPSTTVEAALEKALGFFPDWSSDQDYNGQVDIPLLHGIQNLLDNGLAFNNVRNNPLEQAEFVKIGYKGEELIVEIWPFPLYAYQNEEVASRRRQAAMQRSAEYVAGIDRIVLERDTARQSRVWPHVIQELRDDAITLRVSGLFVEEKAREFHRQAKLRQMAMEKFAQRIWEAGERVRQTVLPSIETVLEIPPEFWRKYQAEHPRSEISVCDCGVCTREIQAGRKNVCPLARSRLFGECARAYAVSQKGGASGSNGS